MIRVAAVPEDIPLEGFSDWLWENGVNHQIVSEDRHQVILIEEERLREPIIRALEQYLDDPAIQAQAPARRLTRTARVTGHWQASPGQAPLTFGIILVAAIVAWITAFGLREDLVAGLTIVNYQGYETATFDQRIGALLVTLGGGEVWRLFTPGILHFSLMHLVFNAVMVWYLGSQIEVLDGKGHAIGVFIVSSLVANLWQYTISPIPFGGLSGVVYAVLGYVWICNYFRPRFQFPPALMTVAIVWLLIGFTPLTEMLLGVSMANAAHLGGLLAGLVYGALLSARVGRG